jgi:O-antigen ligase
MKNLEIIWLAIGIILTNATQLRPESVPIGPGEVMVSIWLILSVIKVLIYRRYLLTPISQIVGLFWLVSLISFTLGLSIADSMNLISNGWPRDYFALGFAFIFSMNLTSSTFFYLRIQEIVKDVIVLSTVGLFIIFMMPSLIPFLETWSEGVRFMGLSHNPNQLSLLLSMIPFFALYLAQISADWVVKIKFFLLIIPCVIMGISTQSDALTMSWLLGLSIIIFMRFYSKILALRAYNLLSPELKNILKLIFRIFVILIILIAGLFLYHKIYNISESVYNEGDQGSLRVTLWKNGITAMSYSPLFGLGPGAHSGEIEPFLGFEAHNTFVDWGSSSGIIGLMAYVCLLAWVAWQTWKAKLFILFAAVISLMVFSSFHYVVRHPIFWFYLLSLASLSMEATKNKFQKGVQN